MTKLAVDFIGHSNIFLKLSVLEKVRLGPEYLYIDC